MNSEKNPSENLDPISGEPGAHPVGTGVGAAVGGAAAGAVAGTVVGPIGTAVGAAVGAIAGGIFGKGVAEGIDPTEDAYWRENYLNRPYVADGSAYNKYQPAYRHGWEARARLGCTTWHESEHLLRSEWEAHPWSRDLSWSEASGAMRDAFDRAPLEPGSPVNRV